MHQNKTGTPSTLIEAIKNGNTPEEIERHVRDYLAQRFGVALLRGDTPVNEMQIMDLWQSITGRPAVVSPVPTESQAVAMYDRKAS